eukprot:gene17619-biopygen10268
MHPRVDEDGDLPQRRDALHRGHQRADPPDDHVALLLLAPEVAAQRLRGARGEREGEASEAPTRTRRRRCSAWIDIGDLIRAPHRRLPMPRARAGGAEAGEGMYGMHVGLPTWMRAAMHTWMRARMHVAMRARMRAEMPTWMRAEVPTWMRAGLPTWMRARMRAGMPTWMRARMRVRMRASFVVRMRARMRAEMPTWMRAGMPTWMRARMRAGMHTWMRARNAREAR